MRDFRDMGDMGTYKAMTNYVSCREKAILFFKKSIIIMYLTEQNLEMLSHLKRSFPVVHIYKDTSLQLIKKLDTVAMFV